jgi:cell division protein FtsB
MVGILAVYSYAQQAAEGLPANVFELLLGNVGTLVLSLIVGYWLYRANQQQRARIEKMQDDALAAKTAEINRLEQENARLWQEVHGK